MVAFCGEFDPVKRSEFSKYSSTKVTDKLLVHLRMRSFFEFPIKVSPSKSTIKPTRFIKSNISQVFSVVVVSPVFRICSVFDDCKRLHRNLMEFAQEVVAFCTEIEPVVFLFLQGFLERGDG